eukprot:5529528-Amphidinium_carterae.1
MAINKDRKRGPYGGKVLITSLKKTPHIENPISTWECPHKKEKQRDLLQEALSLEDFIVRGELAVP